MNDITLRLQQARKNAGFETASDAARRFGWNENTYRSHENGERGIKSRIAERYASALKVDLRWLLLGDVESPFSGQKLISTKGTILANGELSDEIRLSKSGKNELFSAWIDFSVPDDTFAYLVGDNSLLPRYDKFDLLLFWGEPVVDMLKYPRFYQEGIGWDSDEHGHFGHLSHDSQTCTIQCVNSRPKHGLIIRSFDVVQAIVRKATHSGEWIVREEDQR